MNVLAERCAAVAAVACLLAGIAAIDGARARGSEGQLRGTDEEHHLPRMMTIYSARIAHEDPFNEDLEYWPEWWPPLVHRAGAEVFRLFGPGRAPAAAVWFVAHIALAACTLIVVWPVAGIATALASAIVVAFGSSVLHYAGVVNLDLPVAAATAVFLTALLASDGFSRPVAMLLAGAAFGAGLMTKPTFLFFALPAAAAYLIEHRRRCDRRALAWIGGSVAVAALIAGPWYAGRVGPIARAFYFHALDYQAKPGAGPMLTESGEGLFSALAARVGLPVLLAIAWGVVQAFRRPTPGSRTIAAVVLVSFALVAAAPSDAERFWLPALAPGLWLFFFAISRAKSWARYTAAGFLAALTALGGASRIGYADCSVPFVCPRESGAPRMEDPKKLVDASGIASLPAGASVCILSETDPRFHEGYLRYLLWTRRPDLDIAVYGPNHFHKRQFEVFVNALGTCERLVFRTARDGVVRPDGQTVALVVGAGETHSFRRPEGLAKGFFNAAEDPSDALVRTAAEFEPESETRIVISGGDTRADHLLVLGRRRP